MLQDQDRLLGLIEKIHAGVASADGWNMALDGLGDAMGGARLLLGTTPHKAGRFNLSGHRVDPAVMRLINGPLATREANPVFGSIPRAPIHRPVITSRRVAEGRFLDSQVYRDALKPSGVRYTMAVVLQSNPQQALCLAVGRSAAPGDFQDADASLIALLAPHVAAALAVRNELEGARARAAVLDEIDRGIVLLDAAGRICLANREAERILGDNDGLMSAAGALSASRPSETARLRSMVAEAARASAGEGLHCGGFTSIGRPSGRSDYQVRVAPASVTLAEQLGIERQSLAALFVRDLERASPPPPEALIGLYELTKAEAQVAIRIFAGSTLAEAAGELGISNNTAKTHLKSIFQKVGVTRQAQLVRHITLAVTDLPRHGRPS